MSGIDDIWFTASESSSPARKKKDNLRNVTSVRMMQPQGSKVTRVVNHQLLKSMPSNEFENDLEKEGSDDEWEDWTNYYQRPSQAVGSKNVKKMPTKKKVSSPKAELLANHLPSVTGKPHKIVDGSVATDAGKQDLCNAGTKLDSETCHFANGTARSAGVVNMKNEANLIKSSQKRLPNNTALPTNGVDDYERKLVDDLDRATSYGYPVPILIQNEETSVFELDEEALGKVLLAPGIEDKHVCVLAVAGAFRKGKSFLLDFMLRYCANRNNEDWLGDPSKPLTGFKWRQGSKRETTGILVWSQPFIVKRKTGEEVALILMDTQGTFDTQSSMKDSTVVFSLTMMVSSVLVYNLMNNIQEDDLMNLQTFTSYGIQAQEDCDTSHAFQRLLFLVRDWGFPYETPYGHKGGQDVLDEILQISPRQHPAHQDVRRDLRKCFRDINCYLMPHPGFKVTHNATFDGRLLDIEKEFVKHLRVLVPRLLAPENLVKKEFGGQPIKARDLYNFFKTFMEVFKDIDLPEPTTLVEFAARASSQAALEAGKELYTDAMDSLVGGDRPFLKTAQMEAEHEKEKNRAVAFYLEKNKYGRKNQRVVDKYQEQLEEEIDKLFIKYMEQNEAKNVFKAARTPATLFCGLMLFYVISGIFGFVGIYSLAAICNLCMGVFLVMLTLWAYIRYSGEYRDVGIYIDDVATIIWDNALSPVYSSYVEKPLKNAAEQAAHQAMSSAISKATSNSTTTNNNQTHIRCKST